MVPFDSQFAISTFLFLVVVAVAGLLMIVLFNLIHKYLGAKAMFVAWVLACITIISLMMGVLHA